MHIIVSADASNSPALDAGCGVAQAKPLHCRQRPLILVRKRSASTVDEMSISPSCNLDEESPCSVLLNPSGLETSPRKVPRMQPEPSSNAFLAHLRLAVDVECRQVGKHSA